MKNLLLIPLAAVLFACDKEAPVAALTSDKTAAKTGESVELHLSTSDNGRLKSSAVDAIVHPLNGGSPYVIERIFIGDKKRSLNETITYVLPDHYLQDSIVPGDYFEFVSYSEDRCKHLTSVSCIVEIVE